MRLLIIPILLLSVITVFAQATMEATTSDGKKVLLKSDGTWNWIEDKSTKQDNSPSLPSISTATVKTPEDISVFFNDYIGQVIKFESVGIFEIQAVPRTQDKWFGIDVSTETASYSKNINPYQKLNFLMDETLARQVMEEQKEFLKTFPSGRLRRSVNIYAQMRRATDESKMADILCIEFVRKEKNKVSITKSLGNCN